MTAKYKTSTAKGVDRDYRLDGDSADDWRLGLPTDQTDDPEEPETDTPAPKKDRAPKK